MGSGSGEWRRRRSCELSWSEEEAAPCRHVQEFGLDLKSNGRLFREGLFKGACRQDPGRETSGSLGMQWQFECGAGGGDRCEPRVRRKACGQRWRLSKGPQGSWVVQEMQARVGRCR